MKVAVTYDENEMVFQHFGHTERFKLYEIENGEVVSSELVDTAGAGHEALAAFLAGLGVQTLICGGIGSGAVQALDAAGILAHDPNPNCRQHEEGHSCCHGEGGGCCHE